MSAPSAHGAAPPPSPGRPRTTEASEAAIRACAFAGCAMQAQRATNCGHRGPGGSARFRQHRGRLRPQRPPAGRVAAVFYNLTASETNPELQAVQRRMAGAAGRPRQRDLPGRRAVRPHRRAARAARRTGPDAEQRRLLERVHLDFVRAGARLQGAARERYAAGDGGTGRADHALRAERAARRIELAAGAAQRGRPGRAARLRACRGAPGGGRPRPADVAT
jgi:hypothetical protein